MQIVVKASPEQKATLVSMQWAENLHWHWIESTLYPKDADLYLDLCYEEDGWFFKEIMDIPVFVNAVYTLSGQLPVNAIRINAWNSFLSRPIWEIAVANELFKASAIELLEKMGRKTVLVPDLPGLIAGRVVAMIINEAYFALGDEISTKNEIDIAMKLGTNYPYGPFEWAKMIGLSKIANLLNICFLEDVRYALAPALQLELNLQNKSNRS
ncbi:MAG: 3-hydroxyacyl-CoA dehydrogenase family protein [Bacteroidetes bacterium]|nr:3-hydroxyacyl-CoA dehydrogenase family protein [Bacteroidota bacterium]